MITADEEAPGAPLETLCVAADGCAAECNAATFAELCDAFDAVEQRFVDDTDLGRVRRR